MQINENIYGESSSWISSPNYSDNIPRENRLLYANFGNGERTIGYALINDILPLGEPWDNSLSYAALGSNHPLSKIQYYYYDGESEEPKKLKVLNADQRTITNYALGIEGNAGLDNLNVIVTKGTEYSSNKARYNRYNNGAEYSVTYSGYKNFKPFTQIPIKRCVLVPQIKAYNSDFSNGRYFDLNEYILNRKSTFPRITQIILLIVTDRNNTYDPESGTGTPSRSSDSRLTGGVILEPLSYGNGFKDPTTDVETDNTYRPIISEAIAGSLFDTKLPSNQGSNVWCVPVASGFGLDFTKIYDSVDGAINTNDKSRFYCDASLYSNDELREAVRHITACYGLFFADSLSDAESKKLDDPAIMLGTLIDGVGNGDYTSGIDNRQQMQWSLDDVHDIDYDPSNPPRIDPNTYESTSGFNPAINAPDGFNKRYVLSEIDIRTLREDFFQALESKPEDIDYINYTMSKFLTNNPIDCIVSLKWFPFTVPSHGSEVNINLGNYQTKVQAPVYTGSGVEVYSLGSCIIYPYAGSGEPCFLDYAPYTKIELIIPYCGTVELDPSIYMNHTLSVNFIVDIYTGACTAYIMCDGLVSDSVSGVCCVDLPISGIDNATLEGQIYNASLNLKSSKIGEAVSVVNAGLSFGTSLLGIKGNGAKMAKGVVGAVDALTGAIGSVAQSSESLAMNQYQIEHINIPFRTVGSQTGLGNSKQEQFCRLLIYRPKFINGLTNIKQWYNSNEGKLYGHTVGYSCIKTDVISSFHGFTMFSNVDLSGINATDTEKAAILTALQSGVILP